MTNSQWVTLHLFFLTMKSHYILSHQYVSDTAFVSLCHTVSLHSWPSHDQQYVSDTAFYLYHAVSLHCIHDQQPVGDTAFVLNHAVSLHFIPSIGCEWHCIHFSWPCSLIAFHPMTNRMWVTLHLFFWPCSLIALHPMTNSLWVMLHLFFFTMQSHCISSHNQQVVSDTAFVFSWPCSLIALNPMANRE